MRHLLCALAGAAALAATSTVTTAAVVAPTPPMGWSSWNAVGCDVSEQLVRNVSAQLVALGLRELGYAYVNLDDCIVAPFRDNVTGALLPARAFPSGFAALGAALHAQQLRFGFYSDRGFRTCQGLPGLLDSEERDAAQLAAAGVDFLKNDGCFGASPGSKGWVTNGNEQPGALRQYARMQAALRATGRLIVHNVKADVAPLRSCEVAQVRRCGGDIHDDFGAAVASFLNCMSTGIPNPLVGPDCWNDADSLEVGNGGQTLDEYTTHFALWCVGKFPLILGCRLDEARCKNCDSPAQVIAIVQNAELIAVNQDALGRPVSARGVAAVSPPGAAVSVWAGPLAGGAFVLLLLNNSPLNASAATVDLVTALNVSAGTAFDCRDLLAHAPCGGGGGGGGLFVLRDGVHAFHTGAAIDSEVLLSVGRDRLICVFGRIAGAEQGPFELLHAAAGHKRQAWTVSAAPVPDSRDLLDDSRGEDTRRPSSGLRLFATGARDQAVRVWGLERAPMGAGAGARVSLAELGSVAFEAAVTAVAFAPVCRLSADVSGAPALEIALLLAVGLASGRVCLLRGAAVRTAVGAPWGWASRIVAELQGHAGAVRRLSWRPPPTQGHMQLPLTLELASAGEDAALIIQPVACELDA